MEVLISVNGSGIPMLRIIKDAHGNVCVFTMRSNENLQQTISQK